MSKSVLFVYGGYHFLCTAEKEKPAHFRPVLVRRLGWPSEKLIVLLGDAETCRTEAEALRHAEIQAVKWVDSRTAHTV